MILNPVPNRKNYKKIPKKIHCTAEQFYVSKSRLFASYPSLQRGTACCGRESKSMMSPVDFFVRVQQKNGF